MRVKELRRLPIYKRCSLCGKRIKANEKCNCYNTKRSANRLNCDSFYNTTEWRKARSKAMRKTYGLDIYSFYEYGVIEYAFTVHHIKPLEERIDLRSDQYNLIPLTEKNHRAIHRLYESGHKNETIAKLHNYLIEFEREYNQSGHRG